MMQLFGYWAYSMGLWGYKWLLRIAALFNAKATLFVAGRKDLLSHIAAALSAESRNRVWFHCASLGEFEQARPLIEQYKKDYPRFAIVITFFSPSGYEIRKHYAGADYVFYLPLDSSQNAKTFIDIVNPSHVFFVKYEIWYHYLTNLVRKGIPVFLISANFRSNHIYFKGYGVFFKKMLLSFDHIFCQNVFSNDLLQAHGIVKTSVSKDTRFDRVVANRNHCQSFPVVEAFKGAHKALIAGSSYTFEEELIAETMVDFPEWKVIIAPHHIEAGRIIDIQNRFGSFGGTTYSELVKDPQLVTKRVLIIDNIGMLSSLYQYGNTAFIGGGFGKGGIHNTLEAAVFGMPILIGPNNLKKFPETLDMKQAQVAFVVSNAAELKILMGRWSSQSAELTQISAAAKHFVESQTGATNHILGYLQKAGLLK